MSKFKLSGDDAGLTHEVINQSPELVNYNLLQSDLALQEGLETFGAAWANQEVEEHGAILGSEDTIKKGFLANANKPVFDPHDRFGNRLDHVEYHPSYHYFMNLAINRGLASGPWTEPRAGAHVKRAALTFMQYQVEAGHCCPTTMTFASVPTIRQQADFAEYILPKVMSLEYDPRNVPIGEKQGITIGMAMTEKQGGSDVRSNTSQAKAVKSAGPGEVYEITGHKFFVSAPMCDAFLMLAQTGKGLSCFFLPRWLDDGSKNSWYIQRLKDKIGNVSNASSEVELRSARAILVGEEGRGVASIIEMVALTRFDCLNMSAGLMRQAVAQATHHCNYREAFGKTLDKHELMQNVLADLVIEQEAALILSMRLAQALDEAGDSDTAAHLVRIGTAVGKFWICKRSANLAQEAMEIIGGSGVMTNHVLSRLYCEAPINSIWEGSGNVQCLDILRALENSPEVLDSYMAEINRNRGSSSELDSYCDDILKILKDSDNLEFRAREMAEKLAIAMQASLLLRHGKPVIADAFIRSRICGGSARVFGSLDRAIPCGEIIDRARPGLPA